jgi:hypothetical protein
VKIKEEKCVATVQFFNWFYESNTVQKPSWY